MKIMVAKRFHAKYRNPDNKKLVLLQITDEIQNSAKNSNQENPENSQN